jgi:hypothetical protein
LLATQVIARVRTQFELELPLRCIFESPTIALLAVEITCMQLQDMDGNELDRLLTELDGLSDEETRALLNAGE